MTGIHGSSSRKQISSKIGQPELDGALLSPSTLRLVSCGTIGSILFTTAYLIEGISRPGYSALQQAISALSLGPGGWIQQVNFIVFGLLVVCSAYGWYQALKLGAGSIWYPLLKAITGLGLIVDGFFSQDPAPGYPVGAVLVQPTLHGEIHSIFRFCDDYRNGVELFGPGSPLRRRTALARLGGIFSNHRAADHRLHRHLRLINRA